jgi:2-polyprenyl-6-methoxyphenol hydroxylase-like FAD-dependent oxidoreductase
MQFHLNGFRTGDPRIEPPASDAPDPDRLPAEVDVLIVGAGPAGLTLAAQLAAFPGIRTCLVERKGGPLTLGQADGIACRTMEMFDAFGFSERVLQEAYWVNETTFWKPDPGRTGRIVRSGRIQDTADDLSHMPHVILNQARVHDFYLDILSRSAARAQPYYSCAVRKIEIACSDEPIDGGPGQGRSQSHPVTVHVERLGPDHAGQIETVNARFVVGCDGARSSVRQELGLSLEGESANQAWGVMDVLAVTDFPDIRLKTAIHSQNEGSMLIIPREGGYLTRLYIELDELAENERVSDRGITIEKLIDTARRILDPFKLDVKEVAWWSAYEIGQRICPRFDNVPDGKRGAHIPRVFIAGDACHTHSPKAGQGMNVSMQDAFNLGWKLASVLLGRSSPRILHSYSGERHAVAQELIDFDKEIARMFSAQPKDPENPDAGGVDPAEFQAFFEAQGRFTAGTATRYAPSLISGEPSHHSLAKGLTLGMRFHSAPVVRLADAKALQLGEVLVADGRWRLIIFAPAGDGAASGSKVRQLCEFVSSSETSPIRQYTPAGADIDSVIDVRVVFQGHHRDLAIEQLPDLLLPAKGRYGLIDYEKAFCPDLRAGRDIFDMRSIDRRQGCVVVVRPDQYIAHILPLDAHQALSDFFDGFMLAPAETSARQSDPVREPTSASAG